MDNEKRVFTRKEYMNGEVSHHEYYLLIAKDSNVKFSEGFINEVRETSDKEHLNSINMRKFDMLGFNFKRGIARELRARGDTFAPAMVICVLKAMAKHQAGLM